MQKRFGLLFTAALIMGVAFLFGTAILSRMLFVTPATIERLEHTVSLAAEEYSDRVSEVDKAVAGEKERGLLRARLVSARITADTSVLMRLDGLASELGLSAIHVLDGEKKLAYSSVPILQPLDMSGSAKLRLFAPVYEAPGNEIAHFTKGADSELLLLTGVWCQAVGGVVITESVPTDAIDAVAAADIGRVANSVLDGDDYLFAYTSGTREIVFHPEPGIEGTVFNGSLTQNGTAEIGGRQAVYARKTAGDLVFVVVTPETLIGLDTLVTLAACFVTSGAVIFFALSGMIQFWRKNFGSNIKLLTAQVDAIMDGEFENEFRKPEIAELAELSEAIEGLVSSAKTIAVESETVRETAEEASAAKSTFLSHMSHEIRTPLNGIIGFAELALDPEVSKNTLGMYLQKIKMSADGLLEIVNNILDISKIEAGHMELENVPFDLREVIDACQTIISPKAEQKGLTLYCYAEQTLNRKILGDPTKLRQILLNLLSNSVKFTNRGTVKLVSEVLEQNGDTATLRFEVKDSGIGMSREQIEKVFQPFEQADSSITRKYGGTGLGLAISKQMVEKMGGALEVESVEGMGSLFRFDLTFAMTGGDLAPETEKKAVQMKRPTFKGEVLVCEDNEINQNVATEHLAKVGLKAVIAKDGREGVNEYERRKRDGSRMFDLILMDINMPVMDGMEATKALLGLGCKIPIIAMTANALDNGADVYENSGFTDYLSKPFRSQDLWTVLYRYLTPVKDEEPKAPDRMQERLKAKISAPTSDDDDDGSGPSQKLLSDFARTNATTARDIRSAIANNDTKTAHRLAHTLKGLAALIGETSLRQTAMTVESGLEKGKVELDLARLDDLDTELSRVLDKIARRLNPVTDGQSFDKGEAVALFSELSSMLENDDTSALALVSRLKALPQTGVLVNLVEDCDFRGAETALAQLRKLLGV